MKGFVGIILTIAVGVGVRLAVREIARGTKSPTNTHHTAATLPPVSVQAVAPVAEKPCEPEFVADSAGRITIGCPGNGLHPASNLEMARFSVKQARSMKPTPFTSAIGYPGAKFANGVRCERTPLLASDLLECQSHGFTLTVDDSTFEPLR
jgi:hypothetical protein